MRTCYVLSFSILALDSPKLISAGPSQERLTVAQFAVQGVLTSIQVYADFCTAEVPSLAPEFKELMRILEVRVHKIAAPLLGAYTTDSTLQRPVPKELVAAYDDWIRDRRQELAAVDAKKQCPTYLVNYRNTSDEFFRAGLEHTLAALSHDLAKAPSK